MFELLSITAAKGIGGPSVWGIFLVVILLVTVAVNIRARLRAVKVAICQIFLLDGDRRGNFVRIEKAIAEAKSRHADIVCFPETVVLGWLNTDAYVAALPIPGPDSDRLCQLAKKYSTYLCAGIEEKENGQLFNSAILIDEQGRILLKHRQINIPPGLMNPPYTPGEDIHIADTKFGKIGVLVDADSRREDILDRLKALKATLILVPYGYAEQGQNWPKHGQELQNAAKNAAIRAGAVVVGTNAVGQITKGPWAGRVFGGQSVAFDKTGRIIAVAKDRDRDVTITPIRIGRGERQALSVVFKEKIGEKRN
jgi:predicted amidohydrolase